MNRSRYCPPFTPVVDYLPAQVSDKWEVEHFETDEEEVRQRQLSAMFSGDYGNYFDLTPGKYARLLDNEATFYKTTMTDTPMERRTNLEFVERSHGRVLVGGLGLGMVVVPVMAKPEVTSVTVVEVSLSLIDLVLPHLIKLPGSGKLTVVCTDALEYWPPTSNVFNTMYFDIWSTMCTDNLEEMALLHRRWAHRMNKGDPDRWLSSWRHKWLQSRRQAENRSGW